ncbi:MAG: extracellular solute-binding protein, partial [bacterium]
TQEVHEANLEGDIFVPAAWSSCHFPYSEKISSLPWFADIRSIYYRKDIFEKLSLSADDLADWASFERTCEKIKVFKEEEKTIEVFGVSGQKDALLLHNIAPWIWGAGGDFLTPDGKEATFNKQESLDGIAFLIELVRKGYIPVSALKVPTEKINLDFFTKGDYVMAIPGPLSESSPLNPTSPLYNPKIGENCMSSLFPAGTKGRFVFCGGSNLAITSFSQYPKEAWEFVQFLVSYDSQSRYPKTLYMFPTLLESFDSVFIEEKPGWKGLKDAWKYGRAFPNVPAWGAIESLSIECFGKIFAWVQEGDYDISKIRTDLDRVVLDVNDLLAR